MINAGAGDILSDFTKIWMARWEEYRGQRRIGLLAINLEAGTKITPAKVQEFIGISKDYNVFELHMTTLYINDFNSLLLGLL